ncbi:MAG: efflux RND transporter permease subunit, partial [Gemmataceae bacterium]
EAIVFVVLVVFLFLQNIRATLIPILAVPVSIVGSFAGMYVLGFSINLFTLFGLILAIGIVVDDAIVVVENVERWLEEGYKPRDAARKAMEEVTGPVVAVALVLCAVFVPCAFISGITGQFFRQFAITIAVSTVISAFNSLTLSPALSAILLRHREKGSLDKVTFGLFILIGITLPVYIRYSYKLGESLPLWLFWPIFGSIGGAVGAMTFLGFNRIFDYLTAFYTTIVGGILRLTVVVLIGYAGLLYLTYASFTTTPTGFIPSQDKGYLLVNVQLPDSASVQRTQEVLGRIEGLIRGNPDDPQKNPGIPGVQHTVSIAGQSLLLGANGPNLGSMNVILKPFSEREGSHTSGNEIADALRTACREQIRDAIITVMGAPPIDGLGTAGGFKVMIEDRGPLCPEALQNVCDTIVANGSQTAELRGLFTSQRNDTPWLYLDLDRDKCLSMGVQLEQVFNALQIFLGSYYVNQFNEFGRVWQVNIQADSRYRDDIEKIKQIKVPNIRGEMVPLATMAGVRDVSGPLLLMRHNMYAAGAIYGDSKPGISSGQAISRMEEVIRTHLPPA